MESTKYSIINCEVSLELKWGKNCVITSLEQRDIGGGNRDNAPTGATLSITDCKLYVPAVTLSKDDETKLLTNLKSVESGSCNTLDNLMTKLCVPNVIKGVNMQVYNFLTMLNETRNVL